MMSSESAYSNTSPSSNFVASGFVNNRLLYAEIQNQNIVIFDSSVSEMYYTLPWLGE